MTCTTHHEACACRERMYAEEREALRAENVRLKSVIDGVVDELRETRKVAEAARGLLGAWQDGRGRVRAHGLPLTADVATVSRATSLLCDEVNALTKWLDEKAGTTT
jgi:hypothetical protein